MFIIKLILTADRQLNRAMVSHTKQRNKNTKMDSCVYSYFLMVNYKYLLLHTGMKFLTLRLFSKELYKPVHRTVTVLFAVASHTS